MLNFNDIPTVGSIYFAGIGGISMSALAMLLKNKGYNVCGYDRTTSELTDKLEKNGIRVFYDTKESNLDGVSCALYTTALCADHPEILQIRKKGIPLYERAQLLGAIVKMYANSIGVAGTHGKSTTSGMLAYVYLEDKKYDPTVLVGAVLPEIDSTYRIGNDENIVFEACEYKDAFLNFFPKISVVLNVRLDHTDYFPDLEWLVSSFGKFISNTDKTGYSIVNLDSEGAVKAAQNYKGNLVTFSASGNRNADFYASNIVMNKGFAEFDAYKNGSYHMTVSLSVPGVHNISNALAVIACSDLCGISKKTVIAGIKRFKGVSRRFEYKGKFRGADVFDDYAHHPDEIKASLTAAKGMGYNRTVCVFQPHTFSRLHDLFDDFASSFTDCDLPVFADVYSARENNIYGTTSKQLAEKVSGSVYLDSFSEIEEYLEKNIHPGDLLIFMGAGNITELAKKITEK
ncbi:MAG: UDP-N-acetylmuramate--L-alanine ligase [Eubacteriales bacterium]|nr:UDP-N-acetylmuramate--L-alanine ligase [Eubacteriales bacterium]MDD4422443.1 UDP-N-acetylmuramate--L-alanine ligase [Eubacteriales bacterium]HBR32829.1 UDP-N-acetylmuramate--L-alanine ligase [Clostridiales bacterium]